jgi:hypothetical protein
VSDVVFFDLPDSEAIDPEEMGLVIRLRALLTELGPPGLSDQHASARVNDARCVRLRITHPYDPELWLELVIDAGCTEVRWPPLTDMDLFDADDVETLVRGALTTGILQRRRVRLGRVTWSTLYVRSPTGGWDRFCSGGGLAAVLRLLPIRERVEALLYSLGAEPGVRVIPGPVPD